MNSRSKSTKRHEPNILEIPNSAVDREKGEGHLVENGAEFRPEARWQCQVVHFHRIVSSHVLATKMREIGHMLRAIHAEENREATTDYAEAMFTELSSQRITRAAELVEDHIGEILICSSFPTGGNSDMAEGALRSRSASSGPIAVQSP